MLKSILLLIIICISALASQNLKGQNYLLPGEHKYRLIVKFSPEEVLDIETGKPYFSTDRAAPPQVRSALQKYRFNQIIRFSDEEKKLMRSGQTPPPRREQAFNKFKFRGLAFLENAEEMNGEELLEIANELEKLNFVEYAALEPLDPPPPPGYSNKATQPSLSLPPPATPDFSSNQTYRNSSFLNIDYAWSMGIKGQGIRIADIEWGFDYDHEDLKRSRFIELLPTTNHNYDDHGTAVTGILFAMDNGYGVTGMVHQADTFYGVSEIPRGRTAGITLGLQRLRAGDIFIYEMQTYGKDQNYVPADFDQAVWDVTKSATDDGIIVVAAAGNGNENLDDSYYSSYLARGDNGSIIVGAGSANSSREKLSFSTYGSRVNVQGWGQSVTTSGYGALYNGGEHATYTSGFNGTSSATPTVTSAVVAIQSYAKNVLGIILTPREMRSLLMETGRAQGSGGHIGPFPDVKAAIEKLNEIYSARLHIVSNIDDTILSTESEFSFQWTGENISGPISLKLLNSSNDLLLISDDISSDTLYSWLIDSNITTGYRYRLVISHSDASDTSGFFTIMRKKPDQNTVLLDQAGISVVYVSNQENDTGNGAANNVLDCRSNTIWHTKLSVNHPHSIILKTSNTYGISGLSYTRSNEDIYGIITDYRIEISADSISWDTAASGAWNADSLISLVRFDATWGNYVRLTSLASENGSTMASAAQIHLYIEPGYKRDQAITFTTIPDTVTYGDISFFLEAQANSGLPVIFTSSDTAVISISTDTAYIKGAGTVTITASQSGDDSWKEAMDVVQTLTVRKRSVFIRGVTANSKVYDGNIVTTLSGTAELGSVLPGDRVELSGIVSAIFDDKLAAESKFVTVNGYSLSGYDAANYFLQPLQLRATITPKVLSVIGITAQNKVYDGNNIATISGTAEPDSVLPGDMVVLGGTASAVFDDKKAAENRIVTVNGYVLGGDDAVNYYLQPLQLRASITPKPLSVIGIAAQNKVYDGNNIATLSGTAELDSVLPGDIVELSGTVSAVFDDKNANSNKLVTANGYVLNGPDAQNYSLSLPMQLRSAISKAPLSIRADDATKEQGHPDPEFTVTCDGFAAGEDFSVLGGTLQIDRTPEGEEPGEYQIVPSGVTSDNYEIVFGNGTLTIDPEVSVRYPIDSKRGQNGYANSSQENRRLSEQNLCSIIFSNNPVDLSSSAAHFRVKVPTQSVLKIVIYDASGDMLDSRSVRTNNKGESGVLAWDLRNRNGSRVSVGTYLVQVEARGLKSSESYKFRRKLGVARRR